MKNKYDDVLRRLFSQDADIPEQTLERLENVCSRLEINPTQRTDNKYLAKSGRTMILLAAAVLAAALLAGSVLAYSLADTRFYQSIFGKGVSGNEDDRTYYTAEGEKAQYPLNERVEADNEKAESLVGQYVQPLDKVITVGELTFVLHDFIMDENGIVYVGYTVRRTEGMDGFLQEYSGANVSFDGQPYLMNGDMYMLSRSFVNKEETTETTAYIIESFALNCPVTEDTRITLNFGDPNGAGFASVPMPTEVLLPAVGFVSSDGRHTVNMSAVGMAVHCCGHSQSTCSIKEISILYPDGEYIVRSHSKNIENTVSSMAWGVSAAYDMPQPPQYDTVSYVFNRLVAPDEVTEVRLDEASCLPAQ